MKGKEKCEDILEGCRDTFWFERGVSNVGMVRKDSGLLWKDAGMLGGDSKLLWGGAGML